MFSKRTKDEEAPKVSLRSPTALAAVSTEAAIRKGPRVASLITDDMKIEGNLFGDGELQVDGFIRGDLKVARLTIGENGRVEGSIIAESMDCRGRVVGSVTARQVRLYATAHLDGDVTHDELTIEAGAFFQGRALKLQRTPAQPVLVPEPVAVPAA